MSVDEMEGTYHAVVPIILQNLPYPGHALVLQAYLHSLEELEVSVAAAPSVESEIFDLGVYGLLLGRHLEDKLRHPGRCVEVQVIRQADTPEPTLVCHLDGIVDTHPRVGGEVGVGVVVEISAFHYILSCA